jgi:hypothetical protein
MGIRNGLCFAAVLSFVMYGASAHAQTVVTGGGVRLPVAYVDRGITNPAGIVSPELQFNIGHPEVLTQFGGGGVDTIGSMSLGAGYSITDDVGVRGTALVAQFNDPGQLAGAGLGATYRFIRGEFEMGVSLDWLYQTPGASAGQDIVPALPMHIHFGHVARLDITPSIPISTAGIYIPYVGGVGGGKTTVGFDVPLQIAFQIVDQLHIDVGTGFNMTLNPTSSIPGTTFGDFFSIPFGFEIGATIPGPRGPILDMTPYFVWPALFVPGVQNGGNATQSALWIGGINFTIYLYI